VIDHEVEYVRGDIHTQGIENYWSPLKRGIYGVFHLIQREPDFDVTSVNCDFAELLARAEEPN
jgi:hypothetical protein